MIRILTRLAGLAVLATAAASALPSAARAFEVVSPQTERSISLVVGTGQLIRVDSDFASLFVADPDVADIQVRSPRLLYLTGVGIGETTLFAVDEGDNVLMSSNIRVTHNTGALGRALSRVAPGLQATSVDRSLVLTGTVASPEQAADAAAVAAQFVDNPAQVLNRLAVTAPTQVNLQVRIAEVRRNIDRQLGIQWQNGAVPGGFASSTESGIYSLGINRIAGLNLGVVLQALASEGLVSILAEPNLTARSGEPASFLAGGEFPYIVPQVDGLSTTEFREYGVALTFTPTVTDGNNISLKVRSEVSDLDFSLGTDQPGLTTRRAETTVDLGSGQSFAIAGLIQNTSAQNIQRVPGLASLPILGTLFRSTEFQRGQSELVVIVTPVLVRPTSPQALRTPVDAYVPPNDFERILLGRVSAEPARAARVQQAMGQHRLHGAAGFVFE